jgi:hypothetical protein
VWRPYEYEYDKDVKHPRAHRYFSHVTLRTMRSKQKNNSVIVMFITLQNNMIDMVFDFKFPKA